jgi:hypothetical protein
MRKDELQQIEPILRKELDGGFDACGGETSRLLLAAERYELNRRQPSRNGLSANESLPRKKEGVTYEG